MDKKTKGNFCHYSFILPKLGKKVLEDLWDWDKYHKISKENDSNALENLKRCLVSEAFTRENWDFDFTPLVLNVDYLDINLDRFKKQIISYQKEKYILENSTHPAFSFDNCEWLVSIYDKLIEMQLNLIQLMEGILQYHVSNFVEKRILPSGRTVDQMYGNLADNVKRKRQDKITKDK